MAAAAAAVAAAADDAGMPAIGASATVVPHEEEQVVPATIVTMDGVGTEPAWNAKRRDASDNAAAAMSPGRLKLPPCPQSNDSQSNGMMHTKKEDQRPTAAAATTMTESPPADNNTNNNARQETVWGLSRRHLQWSPTQQLHHRRRTPTTRCRC